MGVFNFGILYIDFYFENDILVFCGWDKFWIGFVSVSYWNVDYWISVGMEMWIGEIYGFIWDKMFGSKMFGGYWNFLDFFYGKILYGIGFIGF